MARISSITMVGRAPAVDEKHCDVSFCLFFVTLSNDEVCDNGNTMKRCNLIFKTIMVSLHRGTFVIVLLGKCALCTYRD